MLKTDQILILLTELEEEWYNPPSSYLLRNIEFREASYKHWAIGELRNYIRKQKGSVSVLKIRDFSYKMGCKAAEANDEYKYFMFATAKDVAEDVLDIINAME